MSVTQPHIGVAIAGDTEAPSQQLPGEKLEQYLFEGGATWQLPIRIGSQTGALRRRRRRLPPPAPRRSHARRDRADLPCRWRRAVLPARRARGRPRRGPARGRAREFPPQRHRLRQHDANLLRRSRFPCSLASDIAVQLGGVSASRGGRRVLEDVSLSIGAGEVVALVGRSGSGKTTLLRLINRLIEPDAGSVIVDGRPARSWDPIELRRKTGYVIQDAGLFPHMTVASNIAIVPRLLSWTDATGPRARRRAADDGRTRSARPIAIDGPINCRAASGSASGWPARWRPIPRCC